MGRVDNIQFYFGKSLFFSIFRIISHFFVFSSLHFQNCSKKHYFGRFWRIIARKMIENTSSFCKNFRLKFLISPQIIKDSNLWWWEFLDQRGHHGLQRRLPVCCGGAGSGLPVALLLILKYIIQTSAWKSSIRRFVITEKGLLLVESGYYRFHI